VSTLAFSRVTFAGLLLNFAAIPLMTLVQVSGMMVVPLDAAWPAAAHLAGRAAHLAAEGLVESARLLDVAPWLSYRLPPPHPAAVAVYYSAWAAYLGTRRLPPSRRRSARSARALAAVTIASSLLWIMVEPVSLLWPGVSGRLRVAVLDVGHADAVLVQLPDRRSVLVDTAGSLMGGSFDIGGRVVAPALWALGTRRLDLLVLTHGDPDHVGGAVAVMRDFRPREIWEGVEVPKNKTLADLRSAAGTRGVEWRSRFSGYSQNFGDVLVTVSHPSPPDWERQKVRNDDSMVLEFRYGNVSVVLTGDIGRQVEWELAGHFTPSSMRVLKVPHHGSATSSSEAFVRSLRPRVAVISAGPSTKVAPAVLQRYQGEGAVVFRTDEAGAVLITTDGRSLSVESYANRTRSSVSSENPAAPSRPSGLPEWRQSR
jgi:competence protein ComEC